MCGDEIQARCEPTLPREVTLLTLPELITAANVTTAVDGDSIDRLQEHFQALHVHRLTQRFYQILFEREPQLRELFPQDLSGLYGHFAESLKLVVDNLGRISAVDEHLRHLGVQHMYWGAQPHHYVAARDALIEALRIESGATWDAHLCADWRSGIAAIIVPMLQGAAMHTAEIAQALTEDRDIISGARLQYERRR
jgi:hemoglobin-like flavoprotein